jgi:hypothetical protein
VITFFCSPHLSILRQNKIVEVVCLPVDAKLFSHVDDSWMCLWLLLYIIFSVVIVN